MSMIKFNGVRKAPGRPTLVEGIEGRRYVDSKILKNLESTQRGGGYNAYTSCGGHSPFSYSPGQQLEEFEYGVDENGLSNEPLTPEQQYEMLNGYGQEALEEPTHVEPYYEEFQYHESQCFVAAYDAGEITSSQNLVWTQDAGAETACNETISVEENSAELTDSSEQPYVEQLSQFENCHWQFTLPSTIVQELPGAQADSPAQNLYDEVHYELERVCQKHQFGSEKFEYAVEIRPFDGPQLQRKELITEEGFEIGDLFKACVDHNAEVQRTIEMNIQRRIECAEEMKRIREEFSDLKFQASHSGAMKTGILRLPSSGVVRSSRGTVELLVHANGLTFKPFYNLCGMLMCVAMSDGRRFEKCISGDWRLFSAEGQPSLEKIETVSFDKKGNLWYQTSHGKRVTFFVDGHSETLRKIS